MFLNPCNKCIFYHTENNTCQSKKCATGGEGYVTLFDKIFCKPYTKDRYEREFDTE